MGSGAPNRPPGGPSGNVQVLSTLLGTLEKGGQTILFGFNTEIQSELGHNKA